MGVLPEHVALILDGNGRWGMQHKGRRTAGHIKGAENVRVIVEHAVRIKIQKLTLWGFSSENWNRPQWEVSVLMNLFKRYAIREANEVDRVNIRVSFIGRREELPQPLQRLMLQIEERTNDNTGMRLQIALNYGGEQSIIDAIAQLQKEGITLTSDSLRSAVFGDIGPPDLIIRTGGEKRTSGFMPLASYAEWAFCDTLWPDFSVTEFEKQYLDFGKRERRFGGIQLSKAS